MAGFAILRRAQVDGGDDQILGRFADTGRAMGRRDAFRWRSLRGGDSYSLDQG